MHGPVRRTSHLQEAHLLGPKFVKSVELQEIYGGVGEVVRLVVYFTQERVHVVRLIAPELGQIPHQEFGFLNQVLAVQWNNLLHWVVFFFY